MKQTKWLSDFSCLSEYTRLYPNADMVNGSVSETVLHEASQRVGQMKTAIKDFSVELHTTQPSLLNHGPHLIISAWFAQ